MKELNLNEMLQVSGGTLKDEMFDALSIVGLSACFALGNIALNHLTSVRPSTLKFAALEGAVYGVGTGIILKAFKGLYNLYYM